MRGNDVLTALICITIVTVFTFLTIYTWEYEGDTAVDKFINDGVRVIKRTYGL